MSQAPTSTYHYNRPRRHIRGNNFTNRHVSTYVSPNQPSDQCTATATTNAAATGPSHANHHQQKPYPPSSAPLHPKHPATPTKAAGVRHPISNMANHTTSAGHISRSYHTTQLNPLPKNKHPPNNSGRHHPKTTKKRIQTVGSKQSQIRQPEMTSQKPDVEHLTRRRRDKKKNRGCGNRKNPSLPTPRERGVRSTLEYEILNGEYVERAGLITTKNVDAMARAVGRYVAEKSKGKILMVKL